MSSGSAVGASGGGDCTCTADMCSTPALCLKTDRSLPYGLQYCLIEVNKIELEQLVVVFVYQVLSSQAAPSVTEKTWVAH